jgi:hypothetical protein
MNDDYLNNLTFETKEMVPKIAEKQLKRKITEPFIPLVNEILEHLWNDETTGAKMACIKLMGKMGY